MSKEDKKEFGHKTESSNETDEDEYDINDDEKQEDAIALSTEDEQENKNSYGKKEDEEADEDAKSEDDDEEDSNEQQKSDETQEQPETVDQKLEKSALLDKLYSNVDYGTILAFMDKFQNTLEVKEFTFDLFENSLVNQRTVGKKLIELMVRLLRNLNGCKLVKKDKWETFLVKFVSRFSIDESLLLEKDGFLQTPLEIKVEIFKNLLETQFDENKKFKQMIEQTVDLTSLRAKSVGCDKQGLVYWFFMDTQFSVRLFTYAFDRVSEKTEWKLLLKEENELREFVDKLDKDPELEVLKTSKLFLKNQQKYEDELKAKQNVNESENATNETEVKKEIESEVKAEQKENEKESQEEEQEVVKKEEPKDEQEADEIIRAIVKEEKDEDEVKPDLNESVKQEVEEQKQETKEEVDQEQKEAQDEQKSSAKQELNNLDLKETLKDIVQPIALRKSTRSAGIKAQEQMKSQQIVKSPVKKEEKRPVKLANNKSVEKSTPSKTTSKKGRKSTGALKKSPTKKQKKDEDYEEEEEEDVSDEEDQDELVDDSEDEDFDLKGVKKSSSNDSKLAATKPKCRSIKSNTNKTFTPSKKFTCMKCKKNKNNQVLLLCDGCDFSFHLACMKLSDIPDGDWYCSLCEQVKLVRNLKEKLKLIDEHKRQIELAKHQSIAKRTNRIADIGANLDNLFSGKSASQTQRKVKPKTFYYAEDEEEFEKKKKNVFEVDLQADLGVRSCRNKTKISYTFDEYDKTLSEAMGGQVDENSEEEKPKKKKRNASDNSDDGSDKDETNGEEYEGRRRTARRSNVRRSYKDDDSFDDEESEEDEEEEDGDDMDDNEDEGSDKEFRPSSKKKANKRSKKTSRGRRGRKQGKGKNKRRSSNKYYSDDDEEDEATAAESEESEESFEEFKKKRKRSPSPVYVERRSTRARKCIKEHYFETDEDEEEENKKKKTKRKSRNDDESDFESDLSEPKQKPFRSLPFTSRFNKQGFYSKRKNDESESEFEEENSDEDEKSLGNLKHRSNEKAKSRIKKPWSDEDSIAEQSKTNSENESEEENEDDEESNHSSEHSNEDEDEKSVHSDELESEKEEKEEEVNVNKRKSTNKIESSSSDEEEKVEEKKIESETETKQEEKKEEKDKENGAQVDSEHKSERVDVAVKPSEIVTNGSDSKQKCEKEPNEPTKPIEINGKKQNKAEEKEKLATKETNKNKAEPSPKKAKKVEASNGTTHSTNSYKIDSILMNNSTSAPNVLSNSNGSSVSQPDSLKQPVIQTQSNPQISYSHPYHMNGSYPPQALQTQVPYGSFNNFTMINPTATAPAQMQANNHMFNSTQIGYVNSVSAFQPQQIPQQPYMAPQPVIQANQAMFIHSAQVQPQQPVIPMSLQPQPMYILPTQPMMLPNAGSVPQFQNFYQPTDQNSCQMIHSYYQYQNVQQNP